MRKTCLNQVYELARRDPRVLFIGSDIGSGTLDEFKREMPDRFLMEGVSEAHIVGMMAGLAMNGKIPYLNTIATFLTRRCYEQVALDACLHSFKIRLIGSGGGVVYARLGPTHQAIEDIAIMRALPNMTVVAVADADEMARLMPLTLDWPGPIYIRLGKGGDPIVSAADHGFAIGKAILMRRGSDALVVSTGIALKRALDAAAALAEEDISVAVLHVHTVKPLDAEAIVHSASRVRAVVSVEEHTIVGGLGSAVAEVLAEAAFSPARKFARIGFPDVFPARYGSQDQVMTEYGITSQRIVEVLKSMLSTGG